MSTPYLLVQFIKRRFFVVLVVSFIFCFVFFIEAQALSISPVRQEVVVDSGKEQIIKIIIKNDETEEVKLVPEVDAFQIDGETGRAIFGEEDEAKSWFDASPSLLELKPGEQGEFYFIISVPVGTEAESHYLGLFAKQAASDGQVGLESRIGSLLFLHVAGTVQENLTREFFDTEKKFYINLPVKLLLKLRNNGTIHVAPKGEIVIQDFRGKELRTYSVNEKERKVLPGGLWSEGYSLDESVLKKAIGPVKIKATINYGLSQEQIFGSTSFWYIPLSFIIVTGSIIILMLIISIFVWHKRRG